jgi:hypothetical protein
MRSSPVLVDLRLKQGHNPRRDGPTRGGIRMTRLFLMILLLLSSGPAYAEWVLLGTTDEGMTMYADPDTIRRKGDRVKMWELFDFKTIQTVAGDSFLSNKSQEEYDCAEERHRTLAYMWFSGNMGTGKVVYSNSNEGKWEAIEPESVGQHLWKVACAKE